MHVKPWDIVIWAGTLACGLLLVLHVFESWSAVLWLALIVFVGLILFRSLRQSNAPKEAQK